MTAMVVVDAGDQVKTDHPQLALTSSRPTGEILCTIGPAKKRMHEHERRRVNEQPAAGAGIDDRAGDVLNPRIGAEFDNPDQAVRRQEQCEDTGANRELRVKNPTPKMTTTPRMTAPPRTKGPGRS
jgi:hypothetical protein